MKQRKKIWLFLLGGIFLITSVGITSANASPAPEFEKDFAQKLTSYEADSKGRVERVFDLWWVKKDKNLKENIEVLFSPENHWGVLWSILKYAGFWLIFFYIVYAAIPLLLKGGKPEELKSAMTNILYILIGATFFFGAVWLFGSKLNLTALQHTEGLKDELISNKGIWFFILSFLKGAAFFIAIIMIVITGFKMMNPKTWESGEGKKLVKNLANIIFALVAMKVVDFIYYIAQSNQFAQKAGQFIVQMAKFLAYISGGVMVIMIMYAGYLLIVDGGKGENFKKAKTIIINILLTVVTLFFFLFILYQIFSEFNG